MKTNLSGTATYQLGYVVVVIQAKKIGNVSLNLIRNICTYLYRSIYLEWHFSTSVLRHTNAS